MSARICAILGWIALLPVSAFAEAPPPPPTRPVAYQHVVRREPNLSIHVVHVKLTDPRVTVHVSRGGPDPDGPGPWQTTLLPTSEIAARDHLDVAVNADFFDALQTKDVEGKNTGFVRGKWARPSGPAVSGATCWCHNATTRPAIEFTADHHARIATVPGGAAMPADVIEAVGGSHVIVRDGRAVPVTVKFSFVRHPRTAVGVSADGADLILLVVDGRQPELSVGMTLAELSDEMVRDGAATALNLDGGGSSTLVFTDPVAHVPRVVNAPSDGGTERSVADVLGFEVRAPLPPVK